MRETEGDSQEQQGQLMTPAFVDGIESNGILWFSLPELAHWLSRQKGSIPGSGGGVGRACHREAKNNLNTDLPGIP